jgi:hypothetical protein
MPPGNQTGLSPQDVRVTNVAFYVDIVVSLEGVFSITTAQQSILVGVRSPAACSVFCRMS